MKLKLELVYKALSRSKSFSLIFIANFSLAILSLFLLQFFRESMELSLQSKSKDLLGADIVVSSRFPITNEQKENILKLLPESKKVNIGLSTVSMISSKSRSRLMEVVRIENGFPFYGGMAFRDGNIYPGETKIPAENEVWVYDEVLKLLDLKIGSSLKIGQHSFIIKKSVTEDTLKSVSFSGFIPKVFLSPKGLKKSNLLQFGSTARYKLNYLLKNKYTNDQLEEIENELEKNIDQNLRVLSPNDGRDRLTRVLTFITNFLSLVSLISFFLGLVGLIYLYTGFLGKHKKDMRILLDLGLGQKDLAISYTLHLMALIIASALSVFTLITLAIPVIAPLVQKSIAIDFVFQVDFLFFAKSSLALFALSLSIGLPLILPMLKDQKQSFIKTVLTFTPFILVLFSISHLVTPVKGIGLFFALIIFIFILFIFTIGNFFLNRVDFSGHLKSLSLSLAIKNIIRNKKTSLTLFTAIFICCSLFSLIPQIGSSLSKALNMGTRDKPRFFIVDAQEPQIEGLKKKVESFGAKLQNISPMIRARIIKVNDLDFRDHSKLNKNTEEENELKNRAVNISYRSSLKKSEKILKGKEFSGDYKSDDFSKIVELSVEDRYAKRRGLKLGDKVLFDILGLEMMTKVTNIRTVNWIEFVPNFFLIFQNGAINDAPKKILATISEGEYNPQKMLLALSDAYPSLTIIDVKNIFSEFAKQVKAITSITEKMSFYSIIIGLIMSFIIIQYQMNLQINNILRLKMIGVKNSILRKSLLYEFGLISSLASILGITVGSMGSYIISNLLFESFWDFRPALILFYLVLIPGLTLIIVNYFSSKVIHQKENQLFGE